MKMSFIILMMISGVCMVGQGSRMIYEGIVADSYYRPNTFDILFDWTTLSIFGLIIFTVGTYQFYTYLKNRWSRPWEVQCISCGRISTQDLNERIITCPHCGNSGEIEKSGWDRGSDKKPITSFLRGFAHHHA